jgi:hypothetical protein
MYSY